MGRNKIYIIGIGPGTEDYLPPIAIRAIESSDCLIGGERVLRSFRHLQKEEIILKGNFDSIIPYLRERDEKRIAVLVSGDPGLYSFLGTLARVLRSEEYEVIPGISTLQMAFARIGETWEDAEIISLHGRRGDTLVEKVKASPKVFLFTDKNFPPEKIASHLLDNGVENRKVIVFEDLSYSNEKIIVTDLEHLREMEDFGLCVMVIKRENSTGLE